MNRQIAKVIADQIVTAITADMLDRSGLQNALEECDDEVRDEISSAWISKVEEILHANIS